MRVLRNATVTPPAYYEGKAYVGGMQEIAGLKISDQRI